MKMKATFFILASTWLFPSSTVFADDANQQKSPSEIIPITTANIRGHEALYREGWFIVSSTEKALRYAKKKGIVATGTAMEQLQTDLASDTKEWGRDLKRSVATGVDTTETIFESGTKGTKQFFTTTHKYGGEAWDFGNETMTAAWDKFLLGNLSLAQRTADDRAALAALPGNYFTNLNEDFQNLHELTVRVKRATATGIEARWSDAFEEARVAFSDSYEKSGTRTNSASALGDIFSGYVKMIYSGLIKPVARGTVQGSEVTIKTAGRIVFLPVASLFIVGSRSVQSVGLSVYYTTSLGVSLISPTVESGLLAGLSLLSYGATPVIYATGGTLGAVNQVAVTGVAPVAGVAHASVKGGLETAQYAALVSYDVAAGTTKVLLNQASAGVALGYNALTALPTQLALAAANSVVFLAWDGPRLVLATAKGDVKWGGETNAKTMSLQNLPVGSVVDMGALSKSPNVEVKVLSDDPDVVNAVLEKLPEDLRVENKNEQ